MCAKTMHSIFTSIYFSNHGSKDGASPLRAKKRVIPVSGWSEEFHPFLWRRRRDFHQHPASQPDKKLLSVRPIDWTDWANEGGRIRVLWRLRAATTFRRPQRISTGARPNSKQIHDDARRVLFRRRGRPASEKDRPAIGASTKVCERAQECACVSQNWNTKIFF